MNWNWAVSQPTLINQSITERTLHSYALLNATPSRARPFHFHFLFRSFALTSAVVHQASHFEWFTGCFFSLSKAIRLWSLINNCEQNFSISTKKMCFSWFHLHTHTLHEFLYASCVHLFELSKRLGQFENREKFYDWFDYEHNTETVWRRCRTRYTHFIRLQFRSRSMI